MATKVTPNQEKAALKIVEDYLAFLLTLGSTSSLGRWEEAAQFLVLPLLGIENKWNLSATFILAYLGAV